MNTLQHIAIIMDGNGRWASAKGKNRTFGHRQGAKVVREITKYCAGQNIKYLTLYAFSTENWLRPKSEVDFLMKLLEHYLQSELEVYQNNNIRFVVIGDVEGLSKKLQKLIHAMQDATTQNTGLTQFLALNYGAKNEIARSAFSLYNRNVFAQAKTLKREQAIEYIAKNIENTLDTRGASDVDLLIRTGGEMRLSNFLLWQCAYAELFFTPTLWPDFSAKELESILQDFYRRIRRFGGL
ncbi:di-trans,poly-cis-decaprenylcistransferase [Helicobacter equorum]|uniref:Isoprenyl transferase n=1 Tax=Helicobacter equorum TaxID=361872 RepID=A0A3D8IR77_9HELI|nr:di-trans,poly-cis-decaprenylcistransferase [Helicobacter equorum]RDU67759.1 di-trans,poly-cis-decaprenylcistransferase [Helicobacter equorum]